MSDCNCDGNPDYGPVVATHTEPGEEPASWMACRVCGVPDPDNPPPQEEDE